MNRKKSQKIEALVVKAIRGLQDVQGSTPREISNYISQEYDVPGPEVRRQVQFALKRGVSYGIFKRLKGGYYTYNKDFAIGHLMDGGDAPIEIRCRSRRGVKKSCYGRKARGHSRRRGRGRSRGRKSGRRRGRRSRGRSRRRGRRRGRRRNREKMRNEKICRDIQNQEIRAARSNSLSGKESASGASTISGSSEEGPDDASDLRDAPITSGVD